VTKAETAQGRTLVGTGVGLRGPHVPQILEDSPPVPWFELLTDNHLSPGGALRYQAETIAERYPVALHGVGMSLGGTDPIDRTYLQKVKLLAELTNAIQISDHLAFTSNNAVHGHELFPLPRTMEALQHVANRIMEIQDVLGVRILVENASTYLEFRDTMFTEAGFLTELCAIADCDILLDVNNVYVNAINHGADSIAFLDALPWQRVKEIHVAGHDVNGQLLIDTHGGPVCPEVIKLLEIAVYRAPGAPVLLEWDTNLPPWDTLWRERQRIETVRNHVNLACSP